MQQRTLLRFVTDAFVSVFWNSFTENFGKYTEKHVKWSSLKRKLDDFVEVFREERMFHNFENSEIKPLQNIFLTLQAFFKVKTYFTTLLFRPLKDSKMKN